MKKILSLCLALIFTLFLVSCDLNFESNISVGRISTSTSTGFKSSYKRFSGSENHKIRVEDGPLNLNIDIVTDEGQIDILIEKDGVKSYAGTDIPTSRFVVTLQESGTYKIKITAKDHKGSFCFDW